MFKLLADFSYGAIAMVVGTAWMLFRNFCHRRAIKNKRGRSMSFCSKLTIQGCFPENCNAWDTIINSVFFYENAKEICTIPELVEQCKQFFFYDRFRSTVKKIGSSYVFVDIADKVNIEQDLIVTRIVSSEEEMLKAIDEIVSEPLYTDGGLDNRLLWRMYRILNTGTGRSAGICRVHHVLGDGISLVGVMSKLCKDINGNPFKLDILEKIGGGASTSFSLGLLWKFITCFFEVLQVPVSAFDSDLKFFLPKKGHYLTFSKKRKTVYFPVLKLSFVKELKDKAGVTVNDVMLAATTGALLRYCKKKNDPLLQEQAGKLRARALLPVAFPRSLKDVESPRNSLRNLWSLISCPMPINGATPTDRLLECAGITSDLKSKPVAFIQLWVQNNILSLAPAFLQRKTAHDAFSRHTMVRVDALGAA